MKSGKSRRLTLSRESIHRLEQADLVQAEGGAKPLTQFGTLCHSCHFGCANFTLFGSCTC